MDKKPNGDEESRKKEAERRLGMKQIAAFTGIPFVLLAGAGVGWGLGWLLDRYFHTGPIGNAVCIMIGIAAGFREVFNMLKDLQ